MAASPPSNSRVVIGLIGMVVLTLLTRLPRLGHPAADYDEQLYSLIGQRMLDGAMPYMDLWDRKPPGLFTLYAVFHAIGGPSPLAYQIAGLLACLAGAWLTYRVGRCITDPGTAALGAMLYPPLMAVYGSHSGQSEVFSVPLLLAMALQLLCACRAKSIQSAVLWSMAAMACGGLALQIKYSVLPSCLLGGIVALALLFRRGFGFARLAGLAIAFAALGLLPTALAGLWFWRAGGWDNFIFANFISIGRRLPMPLSVTIGKQLAYAIPLAVLAMGGLALACILRRRGLLQSPPYWLALGWLGAGIAGLFLGSTIYVYYYAALVPAVILVSLPLLTPEFRWGRVLALALPLWLLAMLNPLAQARQARIERAQLDHLASTIAPLVRDRAHPLFVYDGPAVLYQLSGSALPTRLIYPDHLNNALEAPALPLDPQVEAARILAGQPGVIVTSPQPVTLRNKATEALLAAALTRGYALSQKIEFQNRPVYVYARTPTVRGRN